MSELEETLEVLCSDEGQAIIQDEIDHEAVNDVVKFHASLQPMIDSGFLTPMFVDGEINPVLPEETRKMVEAGLRKATQEIADDIDREMMEMIRNM